MSYIGNKEYDFEVSKGNVANHQQIQITGYNSDVDAAEDVWPQGGDFVPPTTARLHNLVSSSAADDDGSTGATAVRVEGVDGDGDIATEIVTMDGTSNVATVNSYSMINSMIVDTAGTGLVNAGTITATAQTDSTVTSSIPTGLGASIQAVYQVPRGHVAHIKHWNIQSGTFNGNSSLCAAVLLARPLAGAWNVAGRLVVSQNNMTAEDQEMWFSKRFGGGTLLKVRVTDVGSVDTDITTSLTFVLVENIVPTADAILHEDGLGFLLHEDGGAILHE